MSLYSKQGWVLLIRSIHVVLKSKRATFKGGHLAFLSTCVLFDLKGRCHNTFENTHSQM